MTDRPPVRMIATDLDGTLLRSDGSVSPRVRAALANAAEAGIEVVPATGRPRIVTGDVMAQLGFVHHWIFANGSVTWHHGRAELIRGFWMEAALARELMGRIRAELPNAGFAIEYDDDVAYERGFERVVPQLPPVGPTPDLAAAIDRPVQKVLVFHPGRDIEGLHAEVAAIIGDTAVPSYSGLSFIELAASLVTKASAVEHLAADLGIAQGEVAAFGDNHNDLALLRWAGRAYAMENGTADVHEVADEIIGHHDDDAVAHKIEEFITESG